MIYDFHILSKHPIQIIIIFIHYTKVCKDKLPKYFDAGNGCPTPHWKESVCQNLASNELCENTWRDAVNATCGKSISHSGFKIKSLCRESCNHCRKKCLFTIIKFFVR